MASPKFPAGSTRADGRTGRGRPRARCWPAAGLAQGASALALQAKADSLALRPARPATPIWSLRGPELRLQARRDRRDRVRQRTAGPGRSSTGAGSMASPAAEPLTGRPPLAAGGKETLQLPLRHAGTFLCDLGLLGDGQARPSQARAAGGRRKRSRSRSIATRCCLIEDWRLRPDGTAIAPGVDPEGCRAGPYH